MQTLSNAELYQTMRLLTRLVDYADGDETRDRETRRQATRLLRQLAKRKEKAQHGESIKMAKA